MDTMLDIWGSFVIGGMVLVAVITLNIGMAESGGRMTQELLVQENTIDLVRRLEYDLYKIRYGVPSDTGIVAADSASIKFLADIDGDGDVDNVWYYVGSPNQLLSTPNPDDRPLYRIVNGQTVKATSDGIVAFRFSYYNALGKATAVVDSIRAIKVSLDVESPYPYTDVDSSTYSGAHWETDIVPRNIQGD